jgi:hypothetical protein
MIMLFSSRAPHHQQPPNLLLEEKMAVGHRPGNLGELRNLELAIPTIA